MMLDLFQGLSPDKCGIRILMTGTESVLISKKEFGLSGCPKITLDERIRKEKDIEKIMQFRIQNSERLKSYNAKVWRTVEQKLLDSPNPISTVDITMTVMDQADDENGGMEMIKELTKQNGLYEAMIRSVLIDKSDKEREFFRFIFALCTFTQRPLSIYILQEFAKQESMFRNSNLDVVYQIETRLSNFLYVTNTSDEKLAPEVGQGEDKKEDKVAISKQQMVTFRQATFHEYLKNNTNDLIPDPLKSKVSFFVKLTNLLCGKDTDSAGLRDVFQDYAARWFMEHLKDINVKKADPTEGCQVVEAITRVFRNDGDVSRLFEDISSDSDYHSDGADIYDISTDAESSGFENLKVFREWAKKMNFHDEEDLSSQAKEWIEGTIHEPHKMLEILARGHFQRWTETKIYEEAKVPYNFLCRALQLRQGRSDDFEQAGITKIKSLLEYAKEGTLVLHNGSFDEEDREFARELYETNLQQKKTSGPEKFYSHLGLAEHFYGANQADSEDTEDDKPDQRWNLVLEHADEALRAWWKEKGALGSDLNEERCIKAFVLKALSLNQLKQDEEAINTCHRCLEEGFQYNPQISELLSLLVDIHSKNKNWAKLVSIVWQQKQNVQAEFLNHLFYELDTLDKAYLLMEAAVKSNRVDYLIRMVEGAREYAKEKDGPRLFVMTWMLAYIYRIVAKVPRMAEHLMMNGVPDSDQYSTAHAYFAFPGLVTIYQEYFMSACSEKAQLDLIRKLELAIKSYEKNILQDNGTLSKAELALAKMYLGIGNTQQVEAHLNRAFDICIVDLKDSIDSNDQNAFRALAKVLAFLGLETEAQVALSLMCSRVGGSGDELPLPEELNMTMSSPDMDDDNVNQPEENGGTIGNNNTTNAHIRPPINATQLANTDLDHENKDPNIMPLTNEDSTPDQKVEDESESPNSATEIPHSPSAEPHENKKVIGSEEQPKKPKKPSFTFSQDLNFEESGISCDGVCEPKLNISSFEPGGPKLMYCLDCMDVDFCEACHMKQINFFDKGEDGFWFKCCWARHEYLQGPIDGWLGVKNGFIYMENQVEDKVETYKVQFGDWLTSVESRWKKRIKTPTVWDELRARQRPQDCFDFLH
ncbi:Tetratricopeptide-like helical [Penicillium expansum]|nr:Tetratricopeptide-like helical [Penicillium expansum]